MQQNYFSILFTMVLLFCLMAFLAVDAGRPNLQHTPGVLLRDLLDAGNAEVSQAQDGYQDLEDEAASSDSIGSRPGDRDPVIDELLASLTEHGIASERPSAHFLLSLYERLRAGENLPAATGHAHNDHVSQADTIRSFTAQVPQRNGRSNVKMTFRMTGMSPRETTQLAELRIRPTLHNEGSSSHSNHDSTSNHGAKRVQKIKVAVYQNGEKIKQKNYKVKVSRDDSDGVDVLEITRVVRELMENVENTNDTTIEVTIRHKEQRGRSGRRGNRRQRDTRISEREADALLVVYTQDKDFFKKFHVPVPKPQVEPKREHIFSRLRRGAKKNTKRERGICDKKDFTVDFEQIGWGKWIVYPKRFNAYQCGGRCPSPVDQSFDPTNHAIMQSLMRLHDRDVPRPCCVPTRLLPLSMLYYEYGEIVIRHHEDMVIDKCGCR